MMSLTSSTIPVTEPMIVEDHGVVGGDAPPPLTSAASATSPQA
jgi:hypothetical protein